MVTLSIDLSDLRKLQRDLDRIQAKLPQAIARGMNEGGDACARKCSAPCSSKRASCAMAA